MSDFANGTESKAHVTGAQPVATRLQPLALIDKCIGSRIWILTKVRRKYDGNRMDICRSIYFEDTHI